MKKTIVAAVLLQLLAAGGATSQESPHGNISIPCESCHSTEDWKILNPPSGFDHGKTEFPLRGQHSAVPCRQCHTTLQFARTSGRCAGCHADIHRGELGTACDRCHSSASWLIPDMPQRHAQTRFALTGAHLNAACEKCHPNQQKSQYIGTPTECNGCHMGDYQATFAPAHAQAGFNTDCVECHAVTAFAWKGSFDHARTAFPLTGAHAAVPCNSCHPGGRFAGTPRDCYSCHQADYAGAANPVHTAGSFPTLCESCHSTTAWRPASLNHEGFFPISAGSKHPPGRWTSCADCHTSPSEYRVFSCITCHAHDKSTMDAKHAGNSRYSYNSQACYNCHPTGRGD